VPAGDAFLSFVRVRDPGRHRDYNRWHQLDHLPENRALAGIACGERWVHSPACGEVARPVAGPLDGVHYAALYLFREPTAASVAAWQDLAERSFQWGRRPDRAWVERPLMGFFSVVAAAVAARLALSPEALPLLPARGVHITVSRPHEPHGDGAEAAWRWHDRVGTPALLETPGVAGVYLFSGISTTLDRGWRETEGSTTFDAGAGEPGQIRVRVCFLDCDPLDLGPAPGAPRPSEVEKAEQVLFEGPLETIVPRRWDWFDDEVVEEAAGGDRA
jgi:hypothetical protein